MNDIEKQNGVDVLLHYFRMVSHFEWQKLTVGGRVVAIGIQLIIFVFIYSGIVEIFFSEVGPSDNFAEEAVKPKQSQSYASIIGSLGGGVETFATGGSDHVLFTGWWIPTESSEYKTKDKTLYLEDGNQRSRFDYAHPVPVEQDFLLELALGGVTGGNFQFGRLSAWELTTGDGDFQTIVFRDGNGNPVAEKHSGLFRSKLNEAILRDVVFLIDLQEERISYDKVRVTVEILEQEFVFEFETPKKWEERDDMYYGLLDYSEGSNKTSLYSPELTENINHK